MRYEVEVLKLGTDDEWVPVYSVTGGNAGSRVSEIHDALWTAIPGGFRIVKIYQFTTERREVILGG